MTGPDPGPGRGPGAGLCPASGAGPSRATTVSFLSDYGHADEFVGVVKSVLRRLAPDAVVVDICHQIAAYDVRAGALALRRAAPWLAPGVVLAVVDPGVGTRRRAVAAQPRAAELTPVAGPPPGLTLVGPDNGLLVPALDLLGGAGRVVVLGVGARPTAATTFDGRDVFAPAAARLCAGADLGAIGDEVDPESLVPGPSLRPTRSAGQVVAEVLWVDRFGNVELGAVAADVEDLGPAIAVELHASWTAPPASSTAPPARGTAIGRRVAAFADLAAGELGLIVDSAGQLALVLDRDSAAGRLRLAPGDRVGLSRCL